MRTGIATWVLGAFLAVASLSAARAQEDDDWGARDRVVSGQVAPLDRILPQIRRNHPGTFYDAQGPFQGADGEMHYRLKWMTPEGRVIWFDANARTGRVLGADVGRRDFGGGGPNYGGGYDRGPNYRGDYDRGPNDGDGQNYGGGRSNFGSRPDYDGGGFGYGPGGGNPAWGGGGRGNWQRGGRGGWGGGHGGWPGGGGEHGGGGFGGGRGGGGGHHGHGG